MAPSHGLGVETLRGFWWTWAVLFAVRHHFKEWRGAGSWEGREGVAGSHPVGLGSLTLAGPSLGRAGICLGLCPHQTV